MLVFFFPFFENLGSYVYDSMRPRTVLFLKGISATIFSLRSKLYGMCARALAVHACPRAPGRPRRLLLSDSEAAPQSRKSRVADKKQTSKPTNTHYSFIGIDTSRLCRTLSGSCPPPALGSRKADIKTLFFFSPRSLPYPCHVRAQAAIKPRHHGRHSCLCLCPAPISFMP